MTEITQADRDAAMKWMAGLSMADHKHLVVMMEDAAHFNRVAERAAIVAWLRAKNLRTANYDANDIEAGEHLK